VGFWLKEIWKMFRALGIMQLITWAVITVLPSVNLLFFLFVTPIFLIGLSLASMY
jgi:hypothetical protein